MADRTVSVALATYNGAAYLQEQLNSYAAQTRLPDELVVCDDGSNDQTLDILERFASRAPFPVHVHRNSVNLGLARNFEKVLSLCTGDLFFLSDQDDVWAPEKLAKVEAVFAAEPRTMVVINDQLLTDTALSDNGVTMLENVAALGYGQDYYVNGCATALRAQWRDRVLPFPEGIAHDTWINRLADNLGVRRVLPEPLQRYRRHGTNNSSDESTTVTPASKLVLSQANGKEEVIASLRAVVKDSEVYIQRIERDRDILHAGVLPEEAIARLRERNAVLERRIAALETSQLRRPAAVLSLLSTGGYSPFQGWKSAARDLLR